MLNPVVRRPLWWLFSLTLLSLLVLGCEHQPTATMVKLQGHTMGTTYHISYIGEQRQSLSFQQNIDALLETVNDQMSTYRPDSELSRFNQHSNTAPFAVAADTASVIAEAIRLAEMTDGALDVTVGPLVNLWGFGPGYRPEKVPSEADIAAARQRVGIEHLSASDEQLSKQVPALYVDLSTIAKGFGVDKVAQYLLSQGITDFMVEVGGELRTQGKPEPQRDWRVAVEKPLSSERAIQRVITPKNNGMATSGDYRIYFEEDGQRFSHIIDPRQAKPINHRLVSVTVLHPSCMTADGLSTAIMVMGPDKGLAFAKKHDLAALLISKTDNGFEEVYTTAFETYLVK